MTWLPPILVGIVAFVAARLAMMPGLGFWDTAELQAVAPVLGIAHPTGFPTYVLLGWLANVLLSPFGEPAFRMNLFAGLSVAVAAAVTVDLVRALTRSDAPRRDGGPRAGPDGHRLEDRHARRGPRPPPRARGDPASAAGRLGRQWTRSDPHRRRDRVRAGRGEPLADAPARPADRPVRPRGRSGHPGAAPVHRGVHRGGAC